MKEKAVKTLGLVRGGEEGGESRSGDFLLFVVTGAIKAGFKVQSRSFYSSRVILETINKRQSDICNERVIRSTYKTFSLYSLNVFSLEEGISIQPLSPCAQLLEHIVHSQSITLISQGRVHNELVILT